MDAKLRTTQRAYWSEYRAWRLAKVRAGQSGPSDIPYEVGDLVEVTLTSLYWVTGRKRREAGETFLARIRGPIEHLVYEEGVVHSRIRTIQAEDNGEEMYDNQFSAKFRLLDPT
jgi:hypothetical protein